MDVANETPTRPWVIYVDGELYGDVKTKTDRDKALPAAGEYARESGGGSCSPSGEGGIPTATTAQAGLSAWPAPEHEPEREAG